MENRVDNNILSFVPMAEEHLDDLVVVEALCFEKGWSRLTLKAVLEDRNSLYLVALLGDKVVGYGGIQTLLDEANLDNIAVLPSHQGRGIGKRLLKQLLKEAKKKDCQLMMLEVRESNKKALDLYRQFGFYQVGQRQDYYRHPLEDAILMNCDLTEQEKDTSWNTPPR